MKAISLLLIAIFLLSCEKEEKPEPDPVMTLQEGYIIGFDPCATYSHVIVTNDFKDTLVAYIIYGDSFINRLDTIYKFPDCYHVLNTGDTIFTFPDYYYYNYREDFRFPDSVINNYKIYLNYSFIAEDEKVTFACTYDFEPFTFNKYVRNRQIKINYATKYPIESVKIK